MPREIENNEKLRLDFEAHLLLERGMSENTSAAYLVDVGHLLDFLEARSISPEATTEQDLHQLLASIHDMGISPRSQARMIAGMRSFFKFMKMEGYIDADPSVLIESPRLG